MDHYYRLEKAPSSCVGYAEALESDIQHANMLAASISRAKGCACIQMKLAYDHVAPVYLFLLRWFDCSCLLQNYLNPFHITVYKVQNDNKRKIPSYSRKATIQQFYDVILPFLAQLHDSSFEQGCFECRVPGFDTIVKNKLDDNNNHLDSDFGKEEECGICLEVCTKMVLPSCCHSMCINCYHDWNLRSESCPFCRGSLTRVNSGELWVMTSREEAVDQEVLEKEDMLRFYLYINSLPKKIPDALFLFYYEYLI